MGTPVVQPANMYEKCTTAPEIFAGVEIKEEAFLAELDSQERLYASKRQGFVGISKFVNSYLGAKGYSFASSHEMIEHLTTSGVIEVHYVPNPFDPERPTAAIRRVAVTAPQE